MYEIEEDRFEREFSEMRRIEMMWYEMHETAEKNPVLRELMDHAIVYYKLSEGKK